MAAASTRTSCAILPNKCVAWSPDGAFCRRPKPADGATGVFATYRWRRLLFLASSINYRDRVINRYDFNRK